MIWGTPNHPKWDHCIENHGDLLIPQVPRCWKGTWHRAAWYYQIFFGGGILLNHIEPWIIGDYTALFGIYAIYLDWYYLIHIYWLRDSGSPLDVWCWWDLGPNAWHVFTPLFFLARCASDFRCVSFGKSSCWEIYGRNSPIPFTWKTTQFRGFQNM
jgi:hypothetical protein